MVTRWLTYALASWIALGSLLGAGLAAAQRTGGSYGGGSFGRSTPSSSTGSSSSSSSPSSSTYDPSAGEEVSVGPIGFLFWSAVIVVLGGPVMLVLGVSDRRPRVRFLRRKHAELLAAERANGKLAADAVRNVMQLKGRVLFPHPTEPDMWVVRGLERAGYEAFLRALSADRLTYWLAKRGR